MLLRRIKRYIRQFESDAPFVFSEHNPIGSSCAGAEVVAGGDDKVDSDEVDDGVGEKNRRGGSVDEEDQNGKVVEK